MTTTLNIPVISYTENEPNMILIADNIYALILNMAGEKI